MAGKHRGEYRDEGEYGDSVSFGRGTPGRYDPLDASEAPRDFEAFEILQPFEPDPRDKPAGRGKRFLIGGLVAGLVGGVAFGGIAVGMFLSGGGTQPEDVLPADTIAFARIDLDPSAGQKLNAVRLLDKFPSLDAKGDDLKATLLEDVFDDNPFGMKYDTDIAPWIGDRAAVAVLPAPGTEDEVTAAVVVEFTDEAKMRAALDKVQAKIDETVAGFEDGSMSGSATAGAPNADSPAASASASPVPGTDPYPVPPEPEAVSPEPGVVTTLEPGVITPLEPEMVSPEPGTDPNADSATRSSVTAGKPAPQNQSVVSAPTPEPTNQSSVSAATPEPSTYRPEEPKLAYAVRENYVFIGDRQAVLDDAVKSDAVLADDATFAADKDAIDGEDQIALAWADISDVYDLASDDEKQQFTELFGDASATGSVVLGVHVEPDYVEATGKLHNFSPAIAGFAAGTHPGTELVRGMPADVTGAVSFTGLGPALAELWGRYESTDFFDLQSAADELHLRLPEDLVAVFGDEFAFAMKTSHDSFDYAARARTDDPERAQEAIDPLLDLTDDITTVPAEGGYALGTDAGFLDAAATGTGGLGEDPLFTTAVPDAEKASSVLFVNLADVVAAFGVDEPDLKPLAAFGLAAFGDSNDARFTLRVTMK